ncbi:MAG: arylesterase [Gammaproteobacteria bacterium]|nr:arylesterase [Gammaproteobacteria bacterium]
MKRLLIILLACCFLSAHAADKSMLVLGDSLSAGHGISIDLGWVHLLQQRLVEQGYSYRVINASIGGDTTRGAYARLEALLAEAQPDIAVIELGGNDGLRGLALDEMFANLAAIIERLIEIDARVLLIPMQLPPNYGKTYNSGFQNVYQQLADSYDVVLSRFILADIAENAGLMQSDGIHPKADAQLMMLDNVWPNLKLLLE